MCIQTKARFNRTHIQHKDTHLLLLLAVLPEDSEQAHGVCRKVERLMTVERGSVASAALI